MEDNCINSSTKVTFNSSPKVGEVVADRRGMDKGNVHTTNQHDVLSFRRELRQHGTPAEAALWKRLKGQQLAGLKFRRQFSVEDYILDFYCPSLRLAIELDGDYHHHVYQPEADFLRDQYLWDKYQIKTLRFENQLVFSSPKDIDAAILFYAEERGVTL